MSKKPKETELADYARMVRDEINCMRIVARDKSKAGSAEAMALYRGFAVVADALLCIAEAIARHY